MNKQEHLLTILGEEGCEIGQICSKINRFGIDEVNILQPNGPSNKYRLIEELNDLLGVAQILVEEGILPKTWQDKGAQQKKIDKVRKFMGYSKEIGTLNG